MRSATVEHTDEGSADRSTARLTARRTDLWFILLLACWSVGLNGLGLGETDFIRHTEADRTLIAWEMLERADFLVPHLLGSVILTKPPLYYWLSAAALWLTGTPDEWSARLVSLFSSLLLVLGQYAFWRLAGFSALRSAAAAFALSTTLSLLILSAVAEIDMLYGMLCSFALYSLYFSLRYTSRRWTIAAYTFLALAFLTKGPPVLFFFGAALVGQAAIMWYQRSSAAQADVRRAFLRGLLSQTATGAAVTTVILLVWLIPLAARVGWDSLGEQLRAEVFERVLYHSERARGPFFYIGSLIAALVPWSAVGLAGLPNLLKERSWRIPEHERAFFLFSGWVALAALLMLSVSEGKSSRYIFPVQAFSLNLILFSISTLHDRSLRQKLFILGSILSGAALIVFPALGVILDLEGVSRRALCEAGIVLGITSGLLYLGCRARNAAWSLTALALMMVGIRFAQFKVYAPYRNATRSVRALALEIDAQLPRGVPVYTVELFERWINYYLKREGRHSERLTPETVYSPITHEGRVFVLLSGEEEIWRLVQLSLYDPTLRVLVHYPAPKGDFLLLDVAAAALPYLKPRETFPTMPSPPFYAERERLEAAPPPGES